jgi:hypothetical protein
MQRRCYRWDSVRKMKRWKVRVTEAYRRLAELPVGFRSIVAFFSKVGTHCVTREVIYVKRNIEMLSCNHYFSGKTISIIYFECEFVALGIQHAMRKRHIILSSLACLRLRYFSTLSHKCNDFEIKVIEHKMYKVVQIWPGLFTLVYTQISSGHIWTTLYILIFSAIFVWNISHCKKTRARYD